jgi:hypothetical protein
VIGLRTATAAALLLSLSACPGPSDDGPDQTQTCAASGPAGVGDAKVLVGEGGAASIAALPAGAKLMLQHGPQGGTHIYLDVMFKTEASGRWTIDTRFTRGPNDEEYAQSVVTACAGWNHIQNLRFIVSAGGTGKLEVAARPLGSRDPALEASAEPITIE